MKHRLIVCLLASACLLGASACSKSQAQGPVAVQDVYTVQVGDTGWDLAGIFRNDPRLWREIVERNPKLQEPGRITSRGGKDYLLLYPGERLYGLQELGVIQTPPAPELVVSAPSQSLRQEWNWRGWIDKAMPWLLVLLAAAALYALYRWILSRPAATSGRPMVRGGVTDEAAYRRFEERGQTQHFDILSLERGRISGVMIVSYAGGRQMPRDLKDETAYRARVRFTDGREEVLYMLQACGNDLRYGGVHRYLAGKDFAFTPTDEVLPAPTPAHEPAPVEAPPAAEASVAPAAAESVPDGSVSIQFTRAKGDQPAMLRVQGLEVEDITCRVEASGISVRYREFIPEVEAA